MRIVAISCAACACVWLGVGCGTDDPPSTPAGRLTVDDLRPLVTVSPAATGWSWKTDPQTRFLPRAFTLEESEPSYAIQKAVADAYEDAGLVRGATSSWWDTPTTKKASSFASLFPSAENARTAMDAEREFARHWFPEFEHHDIREIDADGIGEQSWAVQGGTDDAGFVEIGWTRDNATLSVYVTCSPCASGVAEATRRWARAVDAAAIAASG